MVAAVAHQMSVEEWAALPEDAAGELVDGNLVEEEVPDATHETVIRYLLLALSAYLLPRGGLVFGSGLKLAISPQRGRLGNIVCYSPGRKPPRRGVVRVPPDILVEVVSPGPSDERRDRVQKPEDYAGFGVRWYWLVDPALRTFEIWELDERRRYARALAAEGGTIERVPGCEGLTLDLDALWTEIDALPEDDEPRGD